MDDRRLKCPLTWENRGCDSPFDQARKVLTFQAEASALVPGPGPKLGANRAHTRSRLPTSSAPRVARSSREAIPPARHSASACYDTQKFRTSADGERRADPWAHLPQTLSLSTSPKRQDSVGKAVWRFLGGRRNDDSERRGGPPPLAARTLRAHPVGWHA